MIKNLPPRIAQTIYQTGLIATAIATIAGIWHGIDSGTITQLNTAINALLGMLGIGATATGVIRVSTQRKDGTLDFSGSASDQAVAAINAVNAQAVTAADDLDKVKQAMGSIAGTIPVVGPLAQQVIDSIKLP